MMNIDGACQQIILPGFTENNQGIHFSIQLECCQNPTGGFRAQGQLAAALLPLCKRVKHILFGLQLSWSLLNEYEFQLTADYAEYSVAESQSAGLGFAIGFYNIARQLNGSSPIPDVSGTGLVRWDGSVTEVRHVSTKRHALPKKMNLFTPANINHLSQLHPLLWKYNL